MKTDGLHVNVFVSHVAYSMNNDFNILLSRGGCFHQSAIHKSPEQSEPKVTLDDDYIKTGPVH
jgi:hypothetical protein